MALEPRTGQSSEDWEQTLKQEPEDLCPGKEARLGWVTGNARPLVLFIPDDLGSWSSAECEPGEGREDQEAPSRKN